MTPLRALLRDRTAESHRNLDTLLSTYDLNVDASYGRFLRVQAEALLPLEDVLEEAGIAAVLPDWPQRARSAVILQDVSAVSAQAPQPVALSLPDRRPAALLGIAYVLEGSRLGARYLVRQRKVGAATAFLSHGEGQDLWGSFVSQLEANEDVRAHPERAVAGALFAFSVFLQVAKAAKTLA